MRLGLRITTLLDVFYAASGIARGVRLSCRYLLLEDSSRFRIFMHYCCAGRTKYPH